MITIEILKLVVLNGNANQEFTVGSICPTTQQTRITKIQRGQKSNTYFVELESNMYVDVVTENAMVFYKVGV